MAVSGLLALLDDVTSMLDDGSNLENIATEKTAKIAEDGITSRVTADQKLDTRHEISVVLAVAKGALKNKLLYFIPSTFAIAVFAPWAVVPLCVGSGAYIAYEGVKKLAERHDPHGAEKRRQELLKARQGGKETLLHYERDRIAQAIKTDAALSLELTGFQLGMVAGAPLLTKLAVLGMTSVGATTLLYVTIIGIIGMNDLARTLAEKKGDRFLDRQVRSLGKTMMKMSSPVMKTLAAAGMTALFFVGGHLLSAYIPGAQHALHALGDALSGSPVVQKLVELGATMAAGIAGGVATFGAVKVLGKPLSHVKEKTVSFVKNKAAPKISALGARLKNIPQVLPGLKTRGGAEAAEAAATSVQSVVPASMLPVDVTPPAPPSIVETSSSLPLAGKLEQAFAAQAEAKKPEPEKPVPAPVPPVPAPPPPAI